MLRIIRKNISQIPHEAFICYSYIVKGSLSRPSFGRNVIQKSFLPCSATIYRNYSIGDYDKLWQTVTSGRGQGRSRKSNKATKKILLGDFLRQGKESLGPLHKELISVGAPEENFRQASYQRSFGRGWSGKNWGGRQFGHPELPDKTQMKDFKSIVVGLRRVGVPTKNGKRRRFSATVAVGNGKGAIGWAIGKSKQPLSAARKARNKAVNYLHYVPVTEDKSIYHNYETKIKNTRISFERKPKGYGLRCQRIIRAVCELAGIENIRCKVVGRTTPLTVLMTVFQGLQMQETHKELAERTGKYVVEYRAEQSNRPVVVAMPSEKAVLRRKAEETEDKNKEEDITKYFDPLRGTHRAKKPERVTAIHADKL